MIDTDKWVGLPPITDGTRYGEVIKELNKLNFKMRNTIETEGAEYKSTLANGLRSKLDSHTSYCNNLIKGHLSATGKVHNETPRTVGLEKVDNWRMATTAECINFSDVNAFVHPKGAVAALGDIIGVMEDGYQQNDLFPLSCRMTHHINNNTSYQMSQLYRNIKGLGLASPINDLVMLSSPKGSMSPPYNYYISTNANIGSDMTYYHAGTMGQSYRASHENCEIQTINNTPRTIVDPRSGSAVSVDSNLTSGVPYNGVVCNTAIYANGVSYLPAFLDTADMDAGSNTNLYIEMTGIGIPESSKVGSLIAGQMFETDTGSSVGYISFDADSGSIINDVGDDGTRAIIPITDIITVSGADSVVFDDYKTSSYWEVQDKSYILKIMGRIKVTKGTSYLYVNFVANLRVTVKISSSSTRLWYYRSVEDIHGFSKTTATWGNLSSFNTGYTRVTKPGDVLDFVSHPGCMMPYGNYVRFITDNHHGYVHYTKVLDVEDVIDYFKLPINSLEGYHIETKRVAYAGMGIMGETFQRAIPVSLGTGASYLSYSLNNRDMGLGWLKLNWDDKDNLLTHPANSSEVLPNDFVPPEAINCVMYADNKVVDNNGYAFNKYNNYTGSFGLTFNNSNNKFTTTGSVIFNRGYLNNLQLMEDAFISRAMASYGVSGIEDKLEYNIQIYTANYHGIILLTDGLAYAEIAIVKYSIVDGIYNVDTPIDNVVFKPISLTTKPTKFAGYREDEEVEEDSYSDMHAYIYSNGTMTLSFNNPFGVLKGALTVAITNFNTSSLTFTLTTRRTIKGSLIDGETVDGTEYSNLNHEDASNVGSSFPIHKLVKIPQLFPQSFVTENGLVYYADLGVNQQGADNRAHGLLTTATGAYTAVQLGRIKAGDFVVPNGTPVVLSGRAIKLNRNIGFRATDTSYKDTYYLRRTGDNINPVTSYGVELEPLYDLLEVGYTTGSAVRVKTNDLTVYNFKASDVRKGGTFPITMDYFSGVTI